MKHLIRVSLALLPLTSWAASPFNGTWVADLSTGTTTGKPDTYLVKDGKFTCGTCYPGLTIPADGKTHKVTGHAFYDDASATIVSPSSVKVVNSLNGRTTLERTLTVSADDNTLTEHYVVYNTDGKPSDANNVYKRVKEAPAGSTNALSGDWLSQPSASSSSADLVTFSLQESATGLKMTSPTGQNYDAQFDGHEYPINDDPTKTTVIVEKLGPRKIRETDKRQGKVASVTTMEVVADDKTMHVTDEERLIGQTNTWTANKQ